MNYFYCILEYMYMKHAAYVFYNIQFGFNMKCEWEYFAGLHLQMVHLYAWAKCMYLDFKPIQSTFRGQRVVLPPSPPPPLSSSSLNLFAIAGWHSNNKNMLYIQMNRYAA